MLQRVKLLLILRITGFGPSLDSFTRDKRNKLKQAYQDSEGIRNNGDGQDMGPNKTRQEQHSDASESYAHQSLWCQIAGCF